MKKIYYFLAGFVLLVLFGTGVAYAAYPDFTKVMVVNWLPNQNVTVTNTTPIPVTMGSTQSETKVITLWDNHQFSGHEYSDWVDVNGYSKATVLIAFQGDPPGAVIPYAIEFTTNDSLSFLGKSSETPLMGAGARGITTSLDVMGPKMRIAANTNQDTWAWVYLYLTQ